MKRTRIRLRRKLCFGLAGSLGFVLIWAVLGHILLQYPNFSQFYGFHPIETAKALSELAVSSLFWEAVAASLKRVLIGLSIAFVIAIPLGLLVGFYDTVWMLTHIPIQFLRMISPLSWMPIAILVSSSFENAIYFLITMACIWPIVLSTAQGVNRINPKLISMAKNQGANDFQLVMKIILPSTLPNIVVGLRLALGVAWIVLVPAEFLGITSGLGYSINDARDTLEYDRLLALVISIGFIGLFLDSVVKLFEKKSDLKYILRSS
jgi:NitT/TauT family transport system permease protein